MDGQYTGGWDTAAHRPHGRGKMTWDNGIAYDGEWADGRYHGVPDPLSYSVPLFLKR